MINTCSRLSWCRKAVRCANYLTSLRVELANVKTLHNSSKLEFPRRIPGIKSTMPGTQKNVEKTVEIPLAIAGKYKMFKDADSAVIRNTSEERLEPLDINEIDEEYDEFAGINTKRGKTGVFDIEDLVDILKKENVQDLFVVAVPSHLNYADYICIGTGRGGKHIIAVSEFIRKLFKRKCRKGDVIPQREGKNANDWVAFDLGNIILHIFTEETREVYDLETLWSIGHEYDPKCIETESHISAILERHQIFLHDLEPAKE